ncbi:MAG TPA: NAD(P)/FAD-dependent oxidoreductase [Myxococcaceae bacterium]|nr:NAD(P)/FAD-dependent oxidoreductase [Myxococcaceae bacterium]
MSAQSATDAYRLTNMATWRKLIASLAAIFGAALFLSSWGIARALVGWLFTHDASMYEWATQLADVAWGHPMVFCALLLTHYGGLLIILSVAQFLFRKTTMRRRVRKLLSLLSIGLAVMDVGTWLLVPVSSWARHFLAPLSIIEGVLLAWMLFLPLRQMWLYRRWRGNGGKKVKVVIVGGGFGGLYAAVALDKALGHHRDLELTVVDKNNYFLFPPLLPSVSVGAIETRQVTYPFRRIFETTNIRFRNATVESIAPAINTVTAKFEVDNMGGESCLPTEVPYDYLILAPGSTTNTFLTPGVDRFAFFMRELGDAVAVRNHAIDCFERAAASTSVALQKELLRFVVIGGGPTGLEVATEIHDLIEHVLLARYPEIDPSRPEVWIVQSGNQLLPGWHTKVVDVASRQLSRLKIKIVLDNRAVEVGPRHVALKTGERVSTRTCIWCAGVKSSELLARSGLPLDESGRIRIKPDLRAEGFDNVFALGDAAFLVDKKTGRPLPPLGQVAFQQGPHAARNLVRLLSGKETEPFRYFNFGSLVSVGEHFAAVHLLGVKLSGFFAWLVWRTLYLAKLVGFSNKVRVMLDWSLDLLIERSLSQIQTRSAEALSDASFSLTQKATARSDASEAVPQLAKSVG